MSRFALVAACLLFVNASFVNAAVIYDFNSPAYTAGNISGQNGWTGGSNTLISTVAPDEVLRIGSNQTASHSLVGAGIGDLTTVTYRTFISGGSNVYGEVQLLDSSNTLYAKIGLQDNNDHYYVGISGGGVQTFDTNPVNGGQYYTVTVTVDFAAQKYRATYFHEVSATQLADTGFVNFINPTTTALASNGHVDLLGGSSSSRLASYDYVSISSVPEPYSIVMGVIGLAGVGLVAVHRKKK